MATVSQFAAPRDGEASFWFAYDTIPLGPPGAHERGDSVAVRSPVGTARPHSGLRMAPFRWTFQKSTNLAIATQLTAPSGPASTHSDLRVAPLCWASQEPTNVATVS